MNSTDHALPTTATPTFVPIPSRAPRPIARLGCLLPLAGPLLAFGIWLVAFAALIRPEATTARLQIVVGAAIAVVGAALLAAQMRRVARAAHPLAEPALPAGRVLIPGASVPLRVRQPGPARLKRLRVGLVCERRYTRQAMTPGSTAVSSVDEVEVVLAQELLDVSDVSATRRAPFERVVPLAVPGLARPTGPTLPSGMIAWHLEVVTDTGRGPATRDRFDVIVVLPGQDPLAHASGVARRSADAKALGGTRSGLGAGAGCAVIALGFLLTGPAFLYLYFGGAPTRRGNPAMGLVAGIVFTALGLLGLAGILFGRKR